MVSRAPSFSVPNAVGVPQVDDIALFLCGRAIAAEWPKVSAANASAAEALAAWYLTKVAQMHERPTTDTKGASNLGMEERSPVREAEYCETNEANFSDAFEALSRPAGEIDALVTQKLDREDHQRGWGLSKNLLDGFAKTSGLLLTEKDIMAIDDEMKRSFRCFEELLDICLHFGETTHCNNFIYHIICFNIDNTALSSHTTQMLWNEMGIDDRAAVILPVLSRLFSVCDELGSQHAAGSITHSFIVWLGVSWNCASFSWQTHVSRVTGCLLAELEKKLILVRKDPAALTAGLRDDSTPHARRGPRAKPSQKAFGVSGSNRQLNIVSMHKAMRRICEGRTLDSKGLLEALVESGSGAALPLRDYNNVLEYIFSEQAHGGAVGTQESQQQQWHHSILSNIMNGVLLYSQFYLSVRSLEASLRCAQMGVLVGHQWRSSELLTIAHYNSFLVHVACQDTPAAAGDIAIMLQLADAATRRDGNAETDVNAPRFRAGCLGYMGAALLLLISPGTVDTSLRSIIITGIVAGVRPTSETAGGAGSMRCGGSGSVSSNANALLCTAAEAATGGGSVVVQTTAQTVRHALWLSEMEAFLDPSSTVSTEVITSVARATLMLIAGHYGVCTCTKPIDSDSLAQQLSLIEESTLDSTNNVPEPSELLLRETMRLTAHHALAVQVGTAEAPSGAGPFRILHTYLTAVEKHYGASGLAAVEQNFFFVSTYRFLCAMWLRTCGYLKSAYQELTRLVESMLFYSRCGSDSHNENVSTPAPTTRKASTQPNLHTNADLLGVDEHLLGESPVKMAGSTVKEEETLQFWPPDHLLLWQHVQFERAQLAHYLGYSCVILEISETLRRVSAASHFVMGVLYADLIAAMTWTQRKNYFGALQALEKIESNAESIGLTLVQTHARVRRVSILLACSRWQEALDTLRVMQPIPSLLEHWYLLTHLHAQSEVLMACPDATEGDLATVVDRHIQEMEMCGSFVDVTGKEDSVGITLLDKMCLYACIDRHSAALPERGRQSWDECLNVLARELQQRQLQEGKWQVLWNMPMRNVCNEVLSNALLKRVLKTS
ncbi:hypothetical protein, conserved [Trypanosoma brucei gambiense DAL972]|uniref:Uncharacterized protein n=1 Tax=Trypanosoma brucei gambiense (strain MHOM/CI/86/DAL972) TaxID=679716 RepID=C9ZTP0_TRYB9|nr:hypothetical protein, conserved [Trypanosoma brucei gambiense DAL972]CBH12775.1 hypothetical protein, conserved [Trypanosoma brucei gambiense DAL972]|eukprot:XP_011775055.1 hypothetical protein, conserved [Trypanosoma brucei gambiense DAL972]